ncbi:VOC family protein [Spirulina sp. CCNP1310]|uniref:4-hydroxyphenylpyruvate dioxygenase family protein n=1 Tax=Spirulina sp. CCNP1310 TaxID=3110249 RepID=UPI002B1EEC18|nr:VOC family protein [Spirulina sp. CCNP1310]MEA5418511.1 VOC family protein [Spirulina sp. CCNP1310]
MQIHHLQFYVQDADYWQGWFVQKFGFIPTHRQEDGETLRRGVARGAVWLEFASPQRGSSPVAQYLDHHSPGVAAVAFTVSDLEATVRFAETQGGRLDLTASQPTIITPWGMRHPLYTQSQPALRHQTLTLDHLVLNVPRGELVPVVAWYAAVFGLIPQQRFKIHTADSGLDSQVLRHPHSGLQLPINEPSTPNSQIQTFLDHNGGSGVQHIALAPGAILPLTQRLQAAGVAFLSPPPDYYQQSKKRYPHLPWRDRPWRSLQAAGILIDCPQPDALLLQIFTEPIFNAPTFFIELIERRSQAEGFGAGNFQALFEAIEQQQRQLPQHC